MQNVLNINNHVCWQISEAILQGILLEITTFPKPGLVTPISNGSHNDMNLQSFLLSSAAISPCFTLCAKHGFERGINSDSDSDSDSLKELLADIRKTGIVYEKHLLKSTKGVNTQRGILFLGSVLSGACGYLAANSDKHSKHYFEYFFEYSEVSDVVSKICNNLCENDFSGLSDNQKYFIENTENTRKNFTAGEQLYLLYGVKGIRGEAESGFSTVINHGIPALTEGLNAGFGLNYALVYCLLVIISKCEDTTILWRGGMKSLIELKQIASSILIEGEYYKHQSHENILLLKPLDDFCMLNRLSPGGSADLLAITLAFYILKNGGITNEITNKRQN